MFSDIFMHLLHEHHITAYQLSKETNLSESLISNWKSGRQLPNYNSIKILSDYFNVSSDYLLERTDDPNPYIKTRYELIKNMSIQDMAAAIAEIVSDCRYCGDGCSDCDGGCLSCIEEKLRSEKK